MSFSSGTGHRSECYKSVQYSSYVYLCLNESPPILLKDYSQLPKTIQVQIDQQYPQEIILAYVSAPCNCVVTNTAIRLLIDSTDIS